MILDLFVVGEDSGHLSYFGGGRNQLSYRESRRFQQMFPSINADIPHLPPRIWFSPLFYIDMIPVDANSLVSDSQFSDQFPLNFQYLTRSQHSAGRQ